MTCCSYLSYYKIVLGSYALKIQDIKWDKKKVKREELMWSKLDVYIWKCHDKPQYFLQWGYADEIFKLRNNLWQAEEMAYLVKVLALQAWVLSSVFSTHVKSRHSTMCTCACNSSSEEVKTGESWDLITSLAESVRSSSVRDPVAVMENSWGRHLWPPYAPTQTYEHTCTRSKHTPPCFFFQGMKLENKF